MPNDAKLGLVVGVGLVIAVGVVFFRRDLVTAQAGDRPAGAVTAATAPPAAATPTPPPLGVRDQLHPVKARTAEGSSAPAAPSRRGSAVLAADEPGRE
jgi:hypothetical protein